MDDPFRPRVAVVGPGLLLVGAVFLAACAGRGVVPADRADPPDSRRASQLPDVSGLAWIGGDRFLAVHDAKYPEEAGLVRVSVLELPADLDGIRWTPLDVAFPDAPASDLETVARIPGRPDRFLVAESTEEAAEKPHSNRIFVIEVSAGGASVLDHADWPVPTTNVEGIAVGEAGGALVFVYAERADGLPSSEIRWAGLTLEPLRFGPFRSAGAFTSPGPSGPMARPVSALEFDAEGALYAASAEDPDDDGGPFRSAVYRIGRVTGGAAGPEVALDEVPTLVGTLDGLKVEAIAAREREGGSFELWVGVDDEFYGGTLRRLPEP